MLRNVIKNHFAEIVCVLFYIVEIPTCAIVKIGKMNYFKSIKTIRNSIINYCIFTNI